MYSSTIVSLSFLGMWDSGDTKIRPCISGLSYGIEKKKKFFKVGVVTIHKRR